MSNLTEHMQSIRERKEAEIKSRLEYFLVDHESLVPFVRMFEDFMWRDNNNLQINVRVGERQKEKFYRFLSADIERPCIRVSICKNTYFLHINNDSDDTGLAINLSRIKRIKTENMETPKWNRYTAQFNYGKVDYNIEIIENK